VANSSQFEPCSLRGDAAQTKPGKPSAVETLTREIELDQALAEMSTTQDTGEKLSYFYFGAFLEPL
jgi:hypothetical protein